MEHTDNNLIQQKWLYQKLLKIIPNLPEHLQMGIIELEGKVEGDRTLDFFMSNKESDDVYYIALEQNDEEKYETRLVTNMEVRISLSEQTAIPLAYTNSYEDMRVDLDDVGNSKPQREHKEEVYTLFKTWIKSLDHRGYRLIPEKELPSQGITADEIKRGKSNRGMER
jgi:hypothetical protein